MSGAKTRSGQQLQYLRDRGVIEFVGERTISDEVDE